MVTRIALSLMVIVNCGVALVNADDGPTKEVPELKVLSNYIGKWDVTVTSNNSPFTKGESTAAWVLDGKFVQQTGFLRSADGSNAIENRTLMTYDSDRKVYRMWMFLSDGSTFESTGKWDAKTRTMTSTSQRQGTTTTTTAKFGDDGTEEWLFITKNENNEVVGRFGGINKRRKK